MKVATTLQRSRGRQEAQGTPAEAEATRETQAEVGVRPDTEIKLDVSFDTFFVIGRVHP